MPKVKDTGTAAISVVPEELIPQAHCARVILNVFTELDTAQQMQRTQMQKLTKNCGREKQRQTDRRRQTDGHPETGGGQ